jgi:hypothetical protein
MAQPALYRGDREERREGIARQRLKQEYLMRLRTVLIILVTIVLFSSCAAPQPIVSESREPTPMSVPSAAPVPLTFTVKAIACPSLLAADIPNPYDEINPYVLAAYLPDEALYNALYRAVAEQQPTLDISGYNLSHTTMSLTPSALIGEQPFRFYYYTGYELSEDERTITFSYGNTTDVALNEEIYCARLGQLLYNSIPENGTDLQRYIAAYDYICKISGYSDDMNDEATKRPCDILIRGQGICDGYAKLMKYVLDRLGIPGDYVMNTEHAWNTVQLDGQWYYSDVTWDAGSPGSEINGAGWLLMNEDRRIQSLANKGWNNGVFRVGYCCVRLKSPPECTSSRFDDYVRVGYTYAFDIPNNCVYYNDENGISRMNLDCSGKELLAEGVFANQMVYFDGILYYTDANKCGHLYQLDPGNAPELLDDFGTINYLTLDDTSLAYGLEPGEKTLPLLPFDPADFADATVLPSAQFTRDRTFRFDIYFSAPVNASQDWNQLVYLIDHDGNPLALRFELSIDAQTLTVKPAQCIADEGTVSLCVTGDIASEKGMRFNSPCRMDVSLVSAVQP